MECRYVQPERSLGAGCQFQKTHATEWLHLNDATYCSFHAPMTAVDNSGRKKSDWSPSALKSFNEKICEYITDCERNTRIPNLSGVVFPGDIDLKQFHGGPLQGANCFDAIFCGIVDIGGTISKETIFSNTIFREELRLANSSVNAMIKFSKCYFGMVLMSDSTFFGQVTVTDSTFSAPVIFERSKFKNKMSFVKCNFYDNVLFSHVEFNNSSDFSESVFSQITDFEGSPEVSAIFRINFDDSKFLDAVSNVNFCNRKFRQEATFRNVVFARAPLFHGSILHQGTDFSGCRWLDRGGAAASAYRTLKLSMESIRARDEEAMFNALEIECRRRRADTPGMVKIFSLLYGWACNYGLSLSMPIFWLTGLTVLFFLVYLLGTAPAAPAAPTYSMEVQADVMRFTVAQIVRPFQALSGGYRVEYPFAPDLERPGLLLVH